MIEVRQKFKLNIDLKLNIFLILKMLHQLQWRVIQPQGEAESSLCAKEKRTISKTSNDLEVQTNESPHDLEVNFKKTSNSLENIEFDKTSFVDLNIKSDKVEFSLKIERSHNIGGCRNVTGKSEKTKENKKEENFETFET